jgi:hypothetical protein
MKSDRQKHSCLPKNVLTRKHEIRVLFLHSASQQDMHNGNVLNTNFVASIDVKPANFIRGRDKPVEYTIVTQDL